MFFIGLMMLLPTKVKADFPDPQKGTASDEIENMIAWAMSINHKTKYVLGGGHGAAWNTQKVKDVPASLDCSSYISWAYYRGLGVTLPGGSPASWQFPSFMDHIDTGSLAKAQRGDLIEGNGHIEIYLGQDEDGNHISTHANNARKGLKTTKSGWGNVSGKKILRLNMDDVKAGKKGLKYDESLIKDSGSTGTGSNNNNNQTGEVTFGEGVGFSEEDLFTWLEPIVDFSGTSNTHSQSEEREGTIDSNNKGLRGHKRSIFERMFGRFDN